MYNHGLSTRYFNFITCNNQMLGANMEPKKLQQKKVKWMRNACPSFFPFFYYSSCYFMYRFLLWRSLGSRWECKPWGVMYCIAMMVAGSMLFLFLLLGHKPWGYKNIIYFFRYLYVRWGVELTKMVVIVGESGDTDYEALLGGMHKSLILKGPFNTVASQAPCN